MVLKALLLAVAFLAASASGKVVNVNAAEGIERVEPDKSTLQLGEGWRRFDFGKAGSFVSTNFIIEVSQPVILKVTDYFCAGDRFAVYDNETLLGESSKAEFDECKTTSNSPDWAYTHSDWSSFSFSLEPGFHTIIIKVLQSPYNEGYGAIRIDPLLLKCCLSMSELTLVDSPTPFASANNACESFGMKLAEVDVYNLNDATKVIFGCAGQFGSAYIKSYWGETYQSKCLALYTGSYAPGGTISSPMDCSTPMPVLCQGQTQSCSKTFLRA